MHLSDVPNREKRLFFFGDLAICIENSLLRGKSHPPLKRKACQAKIVKLMKTCCARTTMTV